MLIMTALHVDFWTWQTLHPFLWQWLPFEVWYRALLTLLCTALFWVSSRYLWPDVDPVELKLIEQEEEGRPTFDD